jgi:hypothetical protein
MGVAILAGLVGATAPEVAFAEHAADSSTTSTASPTGSRDSVGELQLKTFAALVGEPEDLVLMRLSSQPDLIPIAMAAGEARMERKRSGKTMTITGFSILGVGVVGGFVLLASGIAAKCSNDGCSSDDSRMELGVLIAAVGSGIGLTLGISGIVRMSSQTSLEDGAIARYRAASPSAVSLGGADPGASTRLRPPPGRRVLASARLFVLSSTRDAGRAWAQPLNAPWTVRWGTTRSLRS